MLACDARAQRVNSAASNDFAGELRRLNCCEAYARKAGGPSILQTAVLPSFANSRENIWPLRAPSVAAAYANRGEWWRDAEAKTEQRCKEFQEVESFYSQQHIDTEARQNAEVRERIAATQRR
jgi:hypothetical protein